MLDYNNFHCEETIEEKTFTENLLGKHFFIAFFFSQENAMHC